jgi:hypothetical protein
MSIDPDSEVATDSNNNNTYECDTSLAELVINEDGAAQAPAADVKASDAESPGPWFDSSPYDVKSPVREVGSMLRAFEEILWNHGADLNAIESVALLRVVHRMRAALAELELAILQPRFVQQRCMPSIGLATGMKECFSRLRGLRNRLQTSPGGAESAKIIDEAGKAFAELMGQQMEQQAGAVGINLKEEKPAAAAAATPKTPAPKQRHRRKRLSKKN